MWPWILVVVLGWLLIAAATLALLTAAKRADAAARPQAAPGAAAASPRRAEQSDAVAWPPPSAALEGLAQAVRRELAVDQVLVVVREQPATRRAVAVAVAGLPASLLGTSLGPRESLAAAIALSGHAVIAPDHGPLTRPGSPAAGDAAAVPLRIPAAGDAAAVPLRIPAAGDAAAVPLRIPAAGDAAAVPLRTPAGAIAIARLGPGARLTADDLQRLRAVVTRHERVAPEPPRTQPAGDGSADAEGGLPDAPTAPRPARASRWPRRRGVVGRAGDPPGRPGHQMSAGRAAALLGAGTALLLPPAACAAPQAVMADDLASAPIAAPGLVADQAPTLAAALPARDPLLPEPGWCAGALDGTAPAGLQRGAMICLVDLVRARAHRRPLSVSPALMRSAALKRRALESCGAFTHTPCGEPFTREFALVGYLRAPWEVGEDLAWGSSYLGIPYAIVNAWLQSPHHRANLLCDCWREQGISVRWVRNWLNRPIAALWVSHFGTRG